jgi:hypothetical protein
MVCWSSKRREDFIKIGVGVWGGGGVVRGRIDSSSREEQDKET